MPFKLMELPYARDALAPYMSEETIDFHYGKHHRKYVENLNSLIGGTRYEDDTLKNIVEDTFAKSDKKDIFNNAAQVWNHDFFWHSMSPPEKSKISSSLLKYIVRDFSSLEEFEAEFIELAQKLFGSGWVWLALDSDKKLKLIKTPNAMNPIAAGESRPLLTCDVWEHAYYLDYQNRREDMVKGFLRNLVNWDFVERNLDSALNLIY